MVLAILVLTSWAQRVSFESNQLHIDGDAMDWLLKTDGTQYQWVTEQYQWGKCYFAAYGINNNEEITNNKDIVC